MNKKEEKVAMEAMTKRLHQLEQVIEAGCVLETCDMCRIGCTYCLARPCHWSIDSRRRGLMYMKSTSSSKRKKLAKAHHKTLVKRIEAKGYVYE